MNRPAMTWGMEYLEEMSNNPLVPYHFPQALSGEKCTCCGHWIKKITWVMDTPQGKSYVVTQTPEGIIREWSFTACVNPRCDANGAVMAAIPFPEEANVSLLRTRPSQKQVNRNTRGLAMSNRKKGQRRKSHNRGKRRHHTRRQ